MSLLNDALRKKNREQYPLPETAHATVGGSPRRGRNHKVLILVILALVLVGLFAADYLLTPPPPTSRNKPVPIAVAKSQSAPVAPIPSVVAATPETETVAPLPIAPPPRKAASPKVKDATPATVTTVVP